MTSILNKFAMARVSCGMETERGPEETGAKSVIEAIYALLVTETEQRINRAQERGICQATPGPRPRELDTNSAKRLRKQRSGGTLVVAARCGAVLPFRKMTVLTHKWMLSCKAKENEPMV